MEYLKPTPTTIYDKLVGKVSDGLSVQLTVPSGVKASGVTGLSVTNGELTWSAVADGVDGNGVTIIQQDPKGNSAALSMSAVDKTIVINLATDGSGVITTTASDIKTAIEANADATALVTVAYSGDGSGLATDDYVVLAGGSEGVVAKNFYLIDHFFGMIMEDADPGDIVALDLELAEYSTNQIKSGDTFAVGTVIYWDDTNKYFTETAGALTAVGIVTEALDSGYIRFKLTNTVI